MKAVEDISNSSPPVLGLPAGLAFASVAGGICISSLCNMTIPFAAALAAILFLVPIFISNRIVRFFLWATAGFLLMSFDHGDRAELASALSADSARIVIRGAITSVPMETAGGTRFFFRIDSSLSKVLVGRIVLVSCRERPPSYGELHLNGTIMPLHGPSIPGSFDERSWADAAGFCAKFEADTLAVADTISPRFQIPALARTCVTRVLEHCQSFETSALIRAIILNETGDLPARTRALFRNSGLYHLLAISGYHVVVLAGTVMLVAGFFGFPLYLRRILAVASAWLYLLFIGPIPSLFRAVVMSTIIFGAPLVGRRTNPLNALCIAGIVLEFLSPRVIFSPGFQLSFGATLGIMTLHPAISALYGAKVGEGWLTPYLRRLVDALSVSFAAFVATAPVVLWNFGMISVYGIIANLVCVPVMAMIMNLFLAAIFVTLLNPYIGSMIMVPIDGLMRLMEFSAKCPFGTGIIQSGRPDAVVIAFICIPFAMAALPRLRNRIRMFAIGIGLASILTMIWLNIKAKQDEFIFFKTGHGVSAALRDQWGRSIIYVSPGRSGIGPLIKDLDGWINFYACKSIDELVIHTGEDAPRTIASFIDRYRVSSVFLCGPLKSGMVYGFCHSICAEKNIPAVVEDGSLVDMSNGCMDVKVFSDTALEVSVFGKDSLRLILGDTSWVLARGDKILPLNGSLVISYIPNNGLEQKVFSEGDFH